jgi:hypothetical protein
MEPAHNEQFPGTGERHVEQPRLVVFPPLVALPVKEVLWDVPVLSSAHQRRGKALFHQTGYEDHGELQSLGLVHGHNLYGVAGMLSFIRRFLCRTAGEGLQKGPQANQVDFSPGQPKYPRCLFSLIPRLRLLGQKHVLRSFSPGRPLGFLVEALRDRPPRRAIEIGEQLGHASQPPLLPGGVLSLCGQPENNQHFIEEGHAVVHPFCADASTEPLEGGQHAGDPALVRTCNQPDFRRQPIGSDALRFGLVKRVPGAARPPDEDAGNQRHLVLGHEGSLADDGSRDRPILQRPYQRRCRSPD